MASGISLSGYSSGIDTASIVEQLMAVERRPVTRLESKNSARQQRISVYSDLKTKLNALKDAANALNSMRDFQKYTASTSDADNEHFSVAVDSYAAATTHTITVQRIALAEKDVSQGFASINSTIATGTFSITIDGVETEIDITSNNNTLDGLRAAINDSGANVTASIMKTGDAGTPYRLVITANETGQAITLDTSGMSGGTVPTFTNGANPGDPGQQAQTALFTFDGVDIESESNEVEDVVTGVDVNLIKADTGVEYTIDVETNIEEIKTAINTFVEKYNDVMSYLKDKNAATSDTRDAALGTIQRSLRAVVSTSVETDGEFTNMSQFGITTDASGTMSVDEDALETALEDNFEDVEAVLTAYGSTSNSGISFLNASNNTVAGSYEVVLTGIGGSFGGTIGGYAASAIGGNLLVGAAGTPVAGLTVRVSGSMVGSYGNVDYSIGVMQNFYNLIEKYTNSADGLIKTKTDAINDQIEDTKAQIEKKEAALEKVEASLKAKFTAMELTLSKLQTQSSYLTSLLF